MAEFQLSEKEFVSACFGMQKKKLIRSSIWILAVFAFIAYTQFSRAPGLQAFYIPMGLVAFFLLVLFFAKRRVSKGYRDQKSLQEHFRVEFSEENVAFTSETGSSLLSWDRILKWSENKNFLYLYQSDLMGSIIPKRALSESELELIYRKLKATKKA